MDIGDNSQNSYGTGNTNRLETKPIRVLMTTDDYEIDGYMHIKPGGYQSRVSDILNVKGLHYIPLTNATYRNIRHPDEPVRKVATLIIRMDTIKMVAPQNGAEAVSSGTDSEAVAGMEGAGGESELPKTGTGF
ncbi:MAG: hypothetical protein Q7K29_01595 [Thermoleophilia bacterium]|nr:hypothetical protein [Thermoleophilia bacterium]